VVIGRAGLTIVTVTDRHIVISSVITTIYIRKVQLEKLKIHFDFVIVH
jgi:hypothetical protein